MSKKPTPKRRKSTARGAKQYGAFKSKVLKRLEGEAALNDCQNCGAKKKIHRACIECGQYRGRQVLDKQKEIDKITTIKA